MTDITSPPDVAGTTTTAGTGPFVISGAIAVPGGGGANYRLWSGVATGSRVHCIRQDAGGANFERGIADVTISAGVATLSWNPRVETSAGGNSPVSWPGGGQQDVWVLGGSIHAANGGIEFSPYAATFRTNIGCGTAAALNVGTGASQIVQLTAAAKLPAVDGSLLTNLPAGTPSIPSGTVLGGFYQASAPSGWTKLTSLTDMILGVTSGTGINPAGGTTSGTSWDNSTGLTVASHTLTVSEMPSHTHPGNLGNNFIMAIGSLGTLQSPGAGSTAITAAITGSTGGNGGHSHDISSSSAWRPPTAYTILCSKN